MPQESVLTTALLTAFLCLVGVTGEVWAQGSVRQDGVVIPGQSASWRGDGEVRAFGLPSRAGMLSNASNAELPDARINFGLGTIATHPTVTANNLNDLADRSLALVNLAGLKRLATVALLRQESTANYAEGDQIYREGYAASGDGGQAFYVWSPISTCTDDGGSCIQPDVGTGRWIASFANDVADARVFGIKFDGTTNNSTALQAAFTWWAKGNKLALPAASACALFGTAISATISSGASATIIGGGQDTSCVTYTGSSGTAIGVTYGDAFSSTHWRDFSLLTNQVGLTEGLSLSIGGTNPNPANSALSDFYRVTIRGSDGYGAAKGFSKDLVITSVSNVNFDGIQLVGLDTGGAPLSGSIGLQLNGTADYPGVVYEIHKSTINFQDTGIQYNANVQGLVVDGGQYIDNNNSIVVTSNTNTGQVTVGGGAGIYGLSAGIWDQAGTTALTVNGGATLAVKTGSVGIKLDKYLTAVINAVNCFPQTDQGGNGTCVSLGTPTSSAGVASIVGNTFQQTAVGVSLAARTTGVIISKNGYYGTTTNIVNSAAGNNYIEDGGWQTYTPTIACSVGTQGSGNSATGYFKNLSEKTVYYEVRIRLGQSGVGTCAGTLISSVPIAAAVGDGGNDYVSAGRDVNTAKMVQLHVLDGTNQLNIYNYDNTSVLQNNMDVRGSGIYQSQ